MMRYVFILAILIALMACDVQEKEKVENDPLLEKIAGKDYASLIEIPTNSNGEIDSAEMAQLTLKEAVFNFDTLFEGDIVEHTFSFQNTGKKALFILQTNSSCGCTVPSYSREPILPGESSSITVVFNSEGKSGIQNRKVTMITNAFPSEKLISMKGYVKQKD